MRSVWGLNLDHSAAFLPDLSGGLDVVVDLGLPDADGLLGRGGQDPRPGHQRRPHAAGAHVHSHVVDLGHEETSWDTGHRVQGAGSRVQGPCSLGRSHALLRVDSPRGASAGRTSSSGHWTQHTDSNSAVPRDRSTALTACGSHACLHACFHAANITFWLSAGNCTLSYGRRVARAAKKGEVAFSPEPNGAREKRDEQADHRR